MDFSQLMKMATEMRERVAGLQDQAADVRVEGEAGGGLVRVVMNGKHEVLSLHIEPTAMVPSEVALVEDLVRAAVNQASQKVGDAMKNRVGEMAKNLGLDPALLSNLF